MLACRRRALVGAVAALGCAGLLAACSGESRPDTTSSQGGSGSTSVSGSDTASTAPPLEFGPDEAAATVAVGLVEFLVRTPVTEVPAGKLFVTGTNMGEETHELVITHAGAPDEEGSIASAEDIAPGETKAIATDLPPGRYQFACYIKEDVDGTTEDHYQLGMVHEFEVK